MSIFEDQTARTADDALAAAEDAQATADRALERVNKILASASGLDTQTHADVLEQLADLRQTTADILRRLERYEARVDQLPDQNPHPYICRNCWLVGNNSDKCARCGSDEIEMRDHL